ncbi:MAG: DUF1572 family protein [Chitinophagaceae bacterium]
MNFQEDFLQYSIKRFENFKDLGDKTFAQLNEKDFFFKPSEESNNIAIIIQHLRGNMISRWTNFLTDDGEKPWRKRDSEFEDKDLQQEELLKLWNEGWKCLFDEMKKLQPEDVTKPILLRSETMPVFDAIMRQFGHVAYHVGQIIVIAKMLKDADWKTLTIPKGKSEEYFEQMRNKKS